MFGDDEERLSETIDGEVGDVEILEFEGEESGVIDCETDAQRKSDAVASFEDGESFEIPA